MEETKTIEEVKCQIVRFCEGLEVEVSRMPNGEFAIPISEACRVVGYQKNWLRLEKDRINSQEFKKL